MPENYEQWEKDAEKRTQKEIELEKRQLAYQEQFEGGNLTEEQYQAAVTREQDFMEPQDNWAPIEPITPTLDDEDPAQLKDELE